MVNGMRGVATLAPAWRAPGARRRTGRARSAFATTFFTHAGHAPRAKFINELLCPSKELGVKIGCRTWQTSMPSTRPSS